MSERVGLFRMRLFRPFRRPRTGAAAHGGILVRCDAAARELLSDSRDVGILQGDLHHGNVLDFGARGWLAIDPKGLVGERSFDYANIFCNPDLSDATHRVATLPDIFNARLASVTPAAKLERSRLLHWILASAGLGCLDNGRREFA